MSTHLTPSEKNTTFFNPPIPILTGLRFFAAFTVLAAHTMPFIVPNLPYNITNYLATTAGEGMQLFFVLSGFVIHYNYSESIKLNKGIGVYNFFIARLARIYPLFIFCIGLELLHAYGYSQLPRDYHHVLPYHLGLIHTWLFKIHNQHNLVYQFNLMSQVSWSVSTELFFYIAYPAIAHGIKKLKSIKSDLSAIALIAITGTLLIFFICKFEIAINQMAVKKYGPIADAFSSNSKFWTQDSFLRWLLYFFPLLRVFEFIIGCITASIFLKLRHKKPTEREEKFGFYALALSLFILVATHKFIFYTPKVIFSPWIIKLHMCMGFTPILALIIFLCARYSNKITKFFNLPIFIRGGEISYSLYLLHLPIAIAFSKDIAHVNTPKAALANCTKLVIVWSCIFGASTIFYKYIEIPFRKIIRKLMVVRSNKSDLGSSLKEVKHLHTNA